MLTHYELWQMDDGHCMFSVPRAGRAQFLHEPGASLLLRFEAASWGEAKAIRDRFLYEDNPDGLVPLDIPASEFLFSRYHCGVFAGEIVRLLMDYHCMSNGCYYGYIDAGTSFVVLPGDIDAPQRLWMRVHHSPSNREPVGRYHSVSDDEHFFSCFERLHESAA